MNEFDATLHEKNATRFDYFLKMIETYFEKKPKTFKELITDPEAQRIGDELLSSGTSTGYNFAPTGGFPLENKNLLIFHNNYIQRPRHFAELLTEIEKEDICTEADMSLGIKGSKVIGVWGDSEAVRGQIVRGGQTIETSETVESVAIFHPKTRLQALKIAGFLITRATQAAAPHDIGGSWLIPDIRAGNHPWNRNLIRINYVPVIANSRRFQTGNLIALKSESKILGHNWKSFPVMVNKELKQFLSDDVVKP